MTTTPCERLEKAQIYDIEATSAQEQAEIASQLSRFTTLSDRTSRVIYQPNDLWYSKVKTADGRKIYLALTDEVAAKAATNMLLVTHHPDVSQDSVCVNYDTEGEYSQRVTLQFRQVSPGCVERRAQVIGPGFEEPLVNLAPVQDSVLGPHIVLFVGVQGFDYASPDPVRGKSGYQVI